AVTEQQLERELMRMQEGYDSEQQFYEVMQEQLGMSKEEIVKDVTHRLLLEQIAVRGIEISDAKLQQYLAEHPEEQLAGTMLHIQQILVPSADEAEEVLELIRNGTDFSDLAAAFSEDDFYVNGDLGWVEADDPFIAEEIMERARAMAVGEISSPIPLSDGSYAVILLKGRKTLTTEERLAWEERLRL